MIRSWLKLNNDGIVRIKKINILYKTKYYKTKNNKSISLLLIKKNIDDDDTHIKYIFLIFLTKI
ncbi:hypothetical protein BpHYR1_044699 [Brachionus plicatilis]|uniref:Uncharacterized protein n=1 Tax=Brachionus plicatilis TaxID=10195 RepID=A0A3M7PLM3_BRAPC|nr:hypothetical protein BpHYR1_044699 [Brachionus plicatilis]